MSRDRNEEAYQDAIKKITDTIVGMNLKAASLLLQEHEWCIRVMKTEKGNCLGTCDLRRNRFNVETKDERIVKVLSVG